MNSSNIGKDLTVNKKIQQNKKDYSAVLTTKKVEYYKKCIEEGIKTDIVSPFHDGNVNLKKARVNFVHTEHEINEIRKCKKDVVYFAENYCYTMTDAGISNVKLRSYQKRILRDLQNNRFCCWIASRQIGKCSDFKVLVKVKVENTEYVLPFYKLYYSQLLTQRKLTLIERIKEKIYDFLYILDI